MRPRQSGFTLIEVLIACLLTPLLMLTAYAILSSIRTNQLVTSGRIEPRQAVRNALNSFGLHASSATVFVSGDGTPITLDGISCRLPRVTTSPLAVQPGDTALVIVPVDLARPTSETLDPTRAQVANNNLDYSLGPDGFCDNRYLVLALTTRAKTAADYSRNRIGTNIQDTASRLLLVMRWDGGASVNHRGIRPPVAFSASSIDISTLGTPDQVSTYDAYLRPLDLDAGTPDQGGFLVSYGLRNSSPASVSIHTEFEYAPVDGLPQREAQDFTLYTRNIFK